MEENNENIKEKLARGTPSGEKPSGSVEKPREGGEQEKERAEETRSSHFRQRTERPTDFPRRQQSRRRGAPHGRGGRRWDDSRPEESEYTETLVKLNRVARVLKGGRRFSFSALVIVGNKKGKVGYGFGKAGDVSEAIRKAIENAKKSVVNVVMYRSTIPHWVIGKSDTSRVLLRPAAPGAGIIAGGPVRIIFEMAGCSDILSKCIGSRNAVNVVKATFDGLSQILVAHDVAKTRGKRLREVWS